MSGEILLGGVVWKEKSTKKMLYTTLETLAIINKPFAFIKIEFFFLCV